MWHIYRSKQCLQLLSLDRVEHLLKNEYSVIIYSPNFVPICMLLFCLWKTKGVVSFPTLFCTDTFNCDCQVFFLFHRINNSMHIWRDIQPSTVTHTQNLCSAINPSKVHTHTAVNTHTHTLLGVRCLTQGHLSRGIEGGESVVHSPPPDNSCRIWDSNSQPLDYESDSLTIRPWLPLLLLLFIISKLWFAVLNPCSV